MWQCALPHVYWMFNDYKNRPIRTFSTILYYRSKDIWLFHKPDYLRTFTNPPIHLKLSCLFKYTWNSFLKWVFEAFNMELTATCHSGFWVFLCVVDTIDWESLLKFIWSVQCNSLNITVTLFCYRISLVMYYIGSDKHWAFSVD